MAYVLLHDPSKQTLTVWLASFTGDRGTAWGPLMAGALLGSIPVAFVYSFFVEHYVSGITGSVKG